VTPGDKLPRSRNLVYKVEAANHFGITVSDLAQCLQFFVGVLGFTAGATVELAEEFSAGITGVDGAVIRVAFVEGPGVTMELVQYLSPPQRMPVRTQPNDVGSAHLAFFVDNLAGIVAASERAGWHLAGAIQPIAVGPRAGGRAAYIRNADGTTLELVQRP
jgi:glyoxylase I family protein